MSKKRMIILLVCILTILIGTTFYIKNNNEKNANKPKELNKIIRDVSPFTVKLKDSNKRNLPPSENLTGYGTRLFDNDGKFHSNNIINYNGKPLKFFVSLVNANKFDDKNGLIIFIDNKIQSYGVENNTDIYSVYSYKLPSYSMINIPIILDLKDKISNGKHKIRFVYLQMMDKEPNAKIKGNEHIPYFTSELDFDLLCSIKDNTTKQNIKVIQDPVNIITKRKDVLSIQGYLMAVDFDNAIKNVYQQVYLNVPRVPELKLRIEAVNDIPGVYTTYLFCDNKPVIFYNGKNSMVWKIDSDQMLSQKISFKSPEILGKHQIYTVTVPMNGSNDFITTSEKVVLNLKR